MKPTTTILIVLLLAGVTFFLASTAFSSLNQRVPVVVAAQALNPGTRITQEMVRVASVHPSGVSQGAFRDVSKVVGQVVMVQRLPGDQITADTVGEQAASVYASALGPDMRAIAVSVTAATGLVGIIRPGDYVSVVGVIDAGKLEQMQQRAMQQTGLVQEPVVEATPTPEPPQGLTARVVLSHLKVLMVPSSFRYEELTVSQSGVMSGSSLEKNPDRGVVLLEVPAARTVVGYLPDGRPLEASPAEVLALLEAAGKVHLVLEPLAAQPVTTNGLDEGSLIWSMVQRPTPVPAVAGG
jgi:Flp pilus assembly protein CpaB